MAHTMKHAEDLDAIHYRNNSGFQYQAAKELIKSHSFKTTDRLLDVGCGDGRITAELAKCIRDGKVIGVDLSPSMISLASSSFTKEEYPNLEYSVCNVEEMDYSDQFDVVMSVNCLHWVEDKEVAFSKISAALVTDGTLLVLVGTRDDQFSNFLEDAANDPRWVDYPRHKAFSQEVYAEQYKDWVENAGLKIIDFELQRREIVFSSKAEFTSFIKIWANYYLPLPEELRSEYLNEVVCRMTKDSSNGNDQEVRIPFIGLMLKAIKTS